MQICIIGAGYVGLVTGTCFAQIGHHVICVDKDQGKIDLLKSGGIPFFEPDLSDLIKANVESGRLTFEHDLAKAILPETDFIFIAVGTPSLPETGQADLQYVFAAATEAAKIFADMNGDMINQPDRLKVFVTKSTVPVGTSREIQSILGEYLSDGVYAVASNPEFLREGNAIGDFMKPDRIVVGSPSETARTMMEELYRPLTRQGFPLVMTSTVETAELTKYAANAFLATKITFINEIARLCEKVDARIDEIALAVGLDSRIGKDFLRTGPGYGGSCFPKDTVALISTANDYGSPIEIIETVVRANDRHKHMMVNKIRQAVGGRASDKNIGVLGLAFKANTDDMRDSPALTILPALIHEGAHLTAFDPEASKNAEALMPKLRSVSEPAQVFENADAVVIMTEWPEFAYLNWAEIKNTMRNPVIVDLRNILDPQEMIESGYDYISLGR